MTFSAFLRKNLTHKEQFLANAIFKAEHNYIKMHSENKYASLVYISMSFPDLFKKMFKFSDVSRLWDP